MGQLPADPTQVLDEVEAREYLNVGGQVGGRTPMWYRYRFLQLMFKGNLCEEWAVNRDKVYDSVLQYLFHQRANCLAEDIQLLTWKYNPVTCIATPTKPERGSDAPAIGRSQSS